jgi:AraC-like DNA-binding protein
MRMQTHIHSRGADTGKPTTPGGTGAGEAYSGAPVVEVLDRRIRTVLALIASRSDCSVRELAQEVHLSSDRLQRLFKQDVGMDISDFLVEQRLQKAARLLSTSYLSIKEIAHAVGYGHHSSFTRAFEHRFGQSPKRFRQQSDGVDMLSNVAFG